MNAVTLTLLIIAGMTLFVLVPAILLTSLWALRKD